MQAILASACAPAVVRFASLMPVRATAAGVIVLDEVVALPTFSEIMAAAFAKRNAEIAANVAKNNSLLWMIGSERGILTPFYDNSFIVDSTRN